MGHPKAGNTRSGQLLVASSIKTSLHDSSRTFVLLYHNYRALIPTLLDLTALFGHVCKELSYKRKEATRPIIHPDFKPLCARTHKVGPLLFGEDLAKCAQDIRSSSKTVMNLITNPGQRAQTIFTKRFSSTQSQARKPFLYQQGRAQFPPRKPQNFQNRKTFTKN